MKNIDKWQPSKFVYKNERLIASRDTAEVGLGSRLAADLVARAYGLHLRNHARGRLLDLGCGKAPLYHVYRDSIVENICVDWKNTSHKNDYLDLEADLTKHLPFDDGEFDTILLSDVLEHIPEPELLWCEMARVLSINGKIIMNVPFCYWLHEQPYDYYRYTEHALRRFAARSGMSVVMLCSIGGAPEIIADVFAKNLLRAGRTGRAASLFVQWATFKIIDTKLGKKISDATKDSFPLGYFLVAQKRAPGDPAI
ncbi:class I SAM-dependent methyltransferase [Comamonadaceae bacterium G21597-S1]|nr:class I SAM-dependent methyltransferase [Comamonadaceae bacterium G21597-S1]